MKLSNDELIEKLCFLGVVSIETKKLISFSGFKNRVSSHKYGKTKRIVFLGQPKSNLFGFYVDSTTDVEALKEAYAYLSNLVKGDMVDYNDDIIQWGNSGIPISYHNIRVI